jgi:hypothetical protein
LVRSYNYRGKKMSGFEREPAVSIDKASIKAIAKAVASELRGGDPVSHLTEPASTPNPCQGKTTSAKIPEPFLVGWGSFAENIQRPNGFKTFFVVDDYTSIGFWNLLGPRLSELPPTMGLKWDVHLICEPIAADSLYRDCGCVRPRFDQQPVIYCVEHGKDVGRYILKATVDEALVFMASEIGGVLEGIATSTVLNWQEQDLPDSWEDRGGVYCTAVGPCSGKTYAIDFAKFLRQYSVHINGSRTSQLFKTEEEAKGWALVLEKMDVVMRG